MSANNEHIQSLDTPTVPGCLHTTGVLRSTTLTVPSLRPYSVFVIVLLVNSSRL